MQRNSYANLKGSARYFSASNVLTILAMLGSLAAGWATLSAENADIKRRVENVEQRSAETRQDIRDSVKEIKQDVKETQATVNTILRAMERVEAAQKARAGK